MQEEEGKRFVDKNDPLRMVVDDDGDANSLLCILTMSSNDLCNLGSRDLSSVDDAAAAADGDNLGHKDREEVVLLGVLDCGEKSR